MSNLTFGFAPMYGIQHTSTVLQQYSNFRAAVIADGGFIADESYTLSLFDRVYNGFGTLILDATIISGMPAGNTGKLYYWNVRTSSLGWFTFARAGTKWVLNSSGQLSEVPANVPAIEYNADGTYKGLLPEPPATNLVLYNNDFSNAYWTKTLVTPTSQANAKFGTVWTLTDSVDASPQLHFLRRDAGLTAGATSTGNKIYAKAGTMTRIRITATGAAITNTGVSSADINLSTGAILAQTINATVNVTPFGDGWYEIECGTTNVEANTRWGVVMLNNSGNATYQGDGTGTVFICRAMKVDNTLVCGSDIPTTGAAASRVADSVTLTGAGSLIGATEGALYAEFETRNSSASGWLLAVDADLSSNRIIFVRNSNNTISAIVTNGGAGQVNIATIANLTGVQRLGFRYKENDFALYRLGNQIGTDVSGTLPTVSRIGIGCAGDGTNAFNGWIRSVVLFTTALDNATLAALTA